MRRIFIQFHELIDANISQRIAEQKELLRNTPPLPKVSIYMRTSTCVHLHAYIYMRTSTCVHLQAYIYMRTSTYVDSVRTGFRGLGALRQEKMLHKTKHKVVRLCMG
jgi:hypothetical protein